MRYSDKMNIIRHGTYTFGTFCNVLGNNMMLSCMISFPYASNLDITVDSFGVSSFLDKYNNPPLVIGAKSDIGFSVYSTDKDFVSWISQYCDIYHIFDITFSVH